MRKCIEFVPCSLFPSLSACKLKILQSDTKQKQIKHLWALVLFGLLLFYFILEWLLACCFALWSRMGPNFINVNSDNFRRTHFYLQSVTAKKVLGNKKLFSSARILDTDLSLYTPYYRNKLWFLLLLFFFLTNFFLHLFR